MPTRQTWDVIVIGGGPAGATAAHDLARLGRSVLLMDREGRIKPCGGAVPPRAIRDFDIPAAQLVARARRARMVAPSGREVDMPVEGGFVGMVDREKFDPFLRDRAEAAGAARLAATFEQFEEAQDGTARITARPKDGGDSIVLSGRIVIGADGARSPVAAQAFPGTPPPPCVFAYHEIVRSPADGVAGFDAQRCDVYYQGELSPDFYAWIFPHGEQASIGVGSANRGFPLRDAVRDLRRKTGLESCDTLRSEGAPIPLKPRRRWDNGRNLVLAGDAAGVVAPASGEGIYYAMLGGRLAAEAAQAALVARSGQPLAMARRRFMSDHGQVFWVLGVMQHFWYRNDKRRERFVAMCADPDVQELTWQAYMNKELVRARPGAHLRIFLRDLAHLFQSPGTVTRHERGGPRASNA